MKKIIITNVVTLNGGDAAILKSTMKGLEDSCGCDVDFIVYDSQPEASQKYYPDLEFRKQLFHSLASASWSPGTSKVRYYMARVLDKVNFLRFYTGLWFFTHNIDPLANVILSKYELETIHDYCSADLVVSSGGTYLVDNYGVEEKVFDLNLSLALSRPLVLFTQSMGPFRKRKNQKLLRSVFPKCRLILLRDEASYRYCAELNAKSDNMHITSDAVFSLADEKVLQVAANTSPLPESPQVAVSVRFWQHFQTESSETGMQRYLAAVKKAVIFLVDHYDADVTFVSTCQGIEEYWVDDAKVAREVYQALPARIQDRVRVDSEFTDPLDLSKRLKSYDLVIATRMHMAILALAAGVPVLPIAYEFKTSELFRRLGVERWLLDIEDVDGASLVATLESFVRSLPSTRKELFHNVLIESKRARESFNVASEVAEL